MPQHDNMWAINGPTMDAVEARLAFQTATGGYAGVGSSGAYLVTPGSGMGLRVAAGRAVVPLTSLTFNGAVHCVLDTDDTTLTVASTASGQYRRDIVILEVLPTGTPWTWRRRVVAGTTAGSANTAVQPLTPANSILLATLLIPPLTTGAVTTGMITDVRPFAGVASTTYGCRAHRTTGTTSLVVGDFRLMVMDNEFERFPAGNGGPMIDATAGTFIAPVTGMYSATYHLCTADYNGTNGLVYVRYGWAVDGTIGTVGGTVGWYGPGYGGIGPISTELRLAAGQRLGLYVAVMVGVPINLRDDLSSAAFTLISRL